MGDWGRVGLNFSFDLSKIVAIEKVGNQYALRTVQCRFLWLSYSGMAFLRRFVSLFRNTFENRRDYCFSRHFIGPMIFENNTDLSNTGFLNVTVNYSAETEIIKALSPHFRK